ncbi:MAG TPA: hypothetical protein VL987_05145, partial [Cellvibrio sp.]|nr:hypothetical protein [Cellvibrio sp.]
MEELTARFVDALAEVIALGLRQICNNAVICIAKCSEKPASFTSHALRDQKKNSRFQRLLQLELKTYCLGLLSFAVTSKSIPLMNSPSPATTK